MWKADTSAFVAALAQAVTAFVALAAAIFAGWQVIEARRTRRAQTQPFVVVDIEPGRVWMNWLTLTVENIGQTLARDVQIKFNPPLTTTVNDPKLAGSSLIRDGITVMPPRRRIETLFDLSHDRLQERLPMQYEVTVSFRDYRNHQQEPLTYIIDLTYLYDLEPIQEKTMHNLVDEVQKLRADLEKWRSNDHGLIVRRPSDVRHSRQDSDWQYALTGTRRSIAYPRVTLGLAWPGRIAFIREPWLRWRQRKVAHASARSQKKS